MSKRAVILSTAILFGFIVVVFRLADLMLLNHERLNRQAEGQYGSVKAVNPMRGGIYDRRGRELAVDIDVVAIYCNPREVKSPSDAASAIQRITGKNYNSLLKGLTSKSKFVWLERKVDADKAREIEALGLKGIGFISEVKRVYPKGMLASHIVGFVGIDNQALEGVELKYNEKLKGKQENIPFIMDASGRMLSDGMDIERGGNSVVLTIDEGLQYIMEASLDKAMKDWSAVSATAVMMDPYTGEILAMANRPTYDLNNPNAYLSSDRRNRAITDTYEPGSIFKLVTAAGVLEEGLVTTSTIFDCSAGRIRVGSRVISDVHNSGVIPFAKVIQKSSNVGTIMASMKLGKERLYEYMKRFGFGSKTGLDLSGESSGKVVPLKKWSLTSQAAASIGYGVSVTPLQILCAYSAIANGGILVKPYMVSRVLSPEGGMMYSANPETKGRVVSERVARILKDVLITVTEEGGTASAAAVDGNRVAGKTGTARLIDSETGQYSTRRYASSFVGFAPADDPKVALIVVVFEPKGLYYGGQVAAPVFRDIVSATLSYLNIPREDNFEENMLVVRARNM